MLEDTTFHTMGWRISLLRTWMVVVLTIYVSEAKPTAEQREAVLDESFSSYIQDNGFRGGSVGVIKNNRLVYADGEGFTGKHTDHAWSVLPIVDISKTITAVGILQLVEDGLLRLEDKVFGIGGVLYYMRPDNEDEFNPNLNDITIEDLLRHSGGWDEMVAPVFDPMLNAYFIRQGYRIVDIAKEMKTFGILNQDDIIRYMLAQPLQFQPGTAVRHSNFGYCVLGRVIEEITDMPYESYIKKNILVPAGMWHTRLGPAHGDANYALKVLRTLSKDNDGYAPIGDKSDGALNLFDVIPAPVLDSTLGWHSNVFDLARFFTVLFNPPAKNKGLLSSYSTVKRFLERPTNPIFTIDADEWGGIGFTVKEDGSFWLESFNQHIGTNVLIYHQGAPIRVFDSELVSLYEYLGFPLAGTDEDTTVIFIGSSSKRHSLKTGLPNMFLPPYGLAVPENGRDVYLDDLGDVDLELDGEKVVVNYKMAEHHLITYSNAMRISGYFPKWVHGFKFDGNSYFLTIFEKATTSQQLEFDISIFADKDRSISHIAKEVKLGYQLTFLQTFHSFSHDNRPAHLAIMSKPEQAMTIEFDIEARDKSYRRALREGAGRFIPVIQSVETRKRDSLVTFLMREVDFDENMPMTFEFDDLDLDRLESVTKEQSRLGNMLIYLDTYHVQGEAHFSALYRSSPEKKNWMMETDMEIVDLTDEMEKWAGYGYLPQLLVAYNRDDETKFVGFWVAHDEE